MAGRAQDLTAADLGLSIEQEEYLDVLDLPQLYSKPSANLLLSTLADLSSEPPSWEATPRTGTPRTATPRSPLSGASTPFRRKRKIKSEGLPRYLTKIISSPLAWIDTDEEKERVWEAASQRLSERSGRTAMGAMSRMFSIPLPPAAAVPTESSEAVRTGEPSDYNDEIIEINLHEPALTADNLGLKTWASSYLLAKRMCLLAPSLPKPSNNAAILELGAGTGLVGLATAAVFQAHVLLTDLPEIVHNLERNSQTNAATLATFGGQTTAAILDWSEPQSLDLERLGGVHDPHGFSLILAADPIYSAEHPSLLAKAVQYHLSQAKEARVVVEMPLRDAFGSERADFRQCMGAIGLSIVEEGEEIGFDDWASGADEDDLLEVKCWWSVWGWR